MALDSSADYDTAAAAEAAAVRDHPTGLANRRGLAMFGAQIVEHAGRQSDAAHRIFVDLSGLKKVNEHARHDAGDEVSVVEAMREVTRATDVVARRGGAEFCVVGPVPGMAPLELDALLGKADQELNLRRSLRRSLRREGSPATPRPASAD